MFAPQPRPEPGGGAAGDERFLVDQAKSDPDMFAILYRRYVNRIYGFAFKRSGSHEVAEDVTSATFEHAWRSLPGFEWRGGGFEPWLWQIASSELAGWFRREQRATTPRAQLGLAALAPSADDDGAAGLDVLAVRAVMGTLRPRYQEALSLHFFSGLDTAGQAAALDCSKAVLAVTVHRALGALRREYNKRAAMHPPARATVMTTEATP